MKSTWYIQYLFDLVKKTLYACLITHFNTCLLTIFFLAFVPWNVVYKIPLFAYSCLLEICALQPMKLKYNSVARQQCLKITET